MPYTIHTAKAKIRDAQGYYRDIDVFSDDLKEALEAIGKDNQSGARGAAMTAITSAQTAAVAQVSNAASSWNSKVSAQAVIDPDLANMLAQNFVSSNSYKAGDYVRYEDSSTNPTTTRLYRLTADYVENSSWDSASKVEVKIGDQISDLKNMTNNNIIDKIDTVAGGINGPPVGTNTSSSNIAKVRRRTTYIPYIINLKVYCDPQYSMVIYYFSAQSSSTIGGELGSLTNPLGNYIKLPAIENANYFRVVLVKVSGDNFEESELPQITLINQIDKINAIESNLSEITSNILSKSLITNDITWSTGSINTSGVEDDSNQNRIRSEFIAVTPKSVDFTISNGYRFAAIWYNSNKDIPCLRDDYWYSTDINIIPPEGTAYLRLVVSKISEETATINYADEIGAICHLSVTGLAEKSEKNQQDINSINANIDEINTQLKYHEQTEVITLLTEPGHITTTGIVKNESDPPVYKHSDYIPLNKGSKITYTAVRVTNMPAIALYRYDNEDADSFDAENSAILPGKSTGEWEMPYDGYVRLLCRIAEIDDGASFTIQNRTGTELAELDERVAALEEGEEESSNIPQYWKTYIDDKLSDLRDAEADVGSAGAEFAFITDVHIPRNNMKSPGLLQYLSKKLNFPFVINGGDFLDDQEETATAIERFYQWREMMNGLTEFCVIGNHDLNSHDGSDSTKNFTKQQFYRMMISQNEWYITSNGNTYYTLDNKNQKFRIIVVDINFTYGDGSAATPQSGSEAEWLQTKLTELESGWTAIIVSHYLWASTTESFETHGQRLIDTINAVYDTVIGSGINFVGVLAGHTHVDYAIKESNKGYNLIATTCDAATSNSGKTTGTTTEQAFDLVFINTTAKTITMKRIGYGEDRNFTY